MGAWNPELYEFMEKIANAAKAKDENLPNNYLRGWIIRISTSLHKEIAKSVLHKINRMTTGTKDIYDASFDLTSPPNQALPIAIKPTTEQTMYNINKNNNSVTNNNNNSMT